MNSLAPADRHAAAVGLGGCVVVVFYPVDQQSSSLSRG